MKRFLLVILLLLLFMPPGQAYQAYPQKIANSLYQKTDLAVFNKKVLFSENNDAANYLKLYDVNTTLTKLIKNSPVPFEYLGLNNTYAVWSQRSTLFVQKGTFWSIKAYNLDTGKTINVSTSKKFNKYPVLSGENVVYYENSTTGSYPRLIKVNIPTGKRSILLSGLHIFNPKVSGNLMLFTSESSNYIYVLNIDSGKIVYKIDCGIQMNDAAFTDAGIIWSDSNQEFSTYSDLYEYFFTTSKINQVIKGLSWGKGHNFISPARVGSYVFYLSGDDASGLDLWMQELKSGGQLTLATNILTYEASPEMIAYIIDKNVYIYQVASKSSSNSTPSLTSYAKTNFPDLNKHWAKETILKLKSLNILTGDKDKSGNLLFRPSENISRAEFATMLCLALKIKGISQKNMYFYDINKHWAFPFINSLQKNGFVSGTGKNTFSPNDRITKAEASVMIVRAKKWTNYKNATSAFKDVPLTYWAYKAISQLKYYNVIIGNTDHIFQPNAQLTKAESAVMISNMLKK